MTQSEQFLLTIPNFERPSKILWVFPTLPTGQDWTSCILSKSLAKIARNSRNLLKEADVEFNAIPLTEEVYQNWLKFYTNTLTELGHDILAKPDWLKNKLPDLKRAWLLSYTKGAKILGGSIVSENIDGVFTHHYKASLRLDVVNQENASLGSLMEMMYLDFCFTFSPIKVTSGLSRNGFGYFNTVGYLISKLRMGYVPEPSLAHTFEQQFPYKSNQTPTIWLAINKELQKKLILYPATDSFTSELLTYIERAKIEKSSLNELQ